MKIKLILIYLICLSVNTHAQKLTGIGLDLGENILAYQLKYKGFSGGIILRSENVKGNNFDFKIGYSDFFGKENFLSINNQNIQYNSGFYFAFSHKFKRNIGWHINFANQTIATKFVTDDIDFNTKFSIKNYPEKIFSIGLNMFYEEKVTISNSLSFNPKIMLGIVLNSKPIFSNSPIYITGNSFRFAFLNLNLGVPLVFNFKK